jgi:hypothetical protein
MSEAAKRTPEAATEELADRLDRKLKISPAEVARRLARDYAGELLKLERWQKMAPPEPGEIILDVGITGTGKSTWAKAMLALWVHLRVVAWDHLDELSIFGRQTDYVMLGSLTERVTIDELRANPSILDKPTLRLAVVPTRRGPEGRAQDFRDFIDLLELDDQERADEETERCDTLPYLLLLEEVARTAKFCAAEYETVATIGRHSGVSVLAVAQWAAAIPHPLRRQCCAIAAHAQTWNIDIDALAEPMGRDDAERVRALKKHERVLWTRTQGREAAA